MIRILAITLPVFSVIALTLSANYAPLLSYRQFDGNLCTFLRPFRTALHMELTPQECYSLAHSGKTERFTFGQRFLHVEAYAVIFHYQLQPSIGGSQRNVYMVSRGVLPDVIKPLLNQPTRDNLESLRQSSHLGKLQSDPARMQSLKAVDQLPQRRAQT